MIQYAEKFLKRQAGEYNEFIIRPQWAYNYSLTGEFMEAYRTKIQAFEWVPTET